MKQLYLRIRYWRQIRKGYGLLSDLGSKKMFLKANDRLFFVNGRDPLVRYDLTTNKVEVYTAPKPGYSVFYKVKANNQLKEK